MSDKIFEELDNEVESLQTDEMAKNEEGLDSPLVVHKKSDASYQADASAIDMNETHAEESGPTLRRHRFKKENNKKSKGLIWVAVIVILAGVFAGLYYTGNISFTNNASVKSTNKSTTKVTTSIQEKYADTIVVKGSYIFVNGTEVDGIEGMMDALKYIDASPTAFTIIDEHANSTILNDNVLPILQDLGFYDESTVITHVQDTGLMAAAENTTTTSTTVSTVTTRNDKSVEE
jgi:hypothetical protein